MEIRATAPVDTTTAAEVLVQRAGHLSGVARSFLKEWAAPDLGAMALRWERFCAQEVPGFEIQRLWGVVKRGERLLDDLEAVIAEAGSFEGSPKETAADVDELPQTVDALLAVERGEAVTRAAIASVEHIASPLREARRLAAVMAAMLPLMVQAAAQVDRRRRVDEGSAAVAAAIRQLTAVRDRTIAADREVADAIAKWERRIGRALPSPALIWPRPTLMAHPSLTEPPAEAAPEP